ncbi:osteoclast stimulatory transmembrane protein [Betta splendens]|uniref:Osteoclast stimulatory transmembrane protein n=1 Tax=Betta splendens TaxID=158456 RepID=A0A6P7N325_BETSP|nr:osteoclast stimulatory transmembrane protein [Betta splendens]
MKLITQAVITPLRSRLLVLRSRTESCRAAVGSVLLYLWRTYSTPTPAGRDVLTQLVLCLSLSVATGALLHHWLHSTLSYGRGASARTACAYGAAAFLLCFLCHPLRCVLTMTLPTACTAQGRRFLISVSGMLAALKVVPNIAANVGAVAHVLRCAAEGFAGTLFNSSELVNAAKRDVVDEAVRAAEGAGVVAGVVASLRKLDRVTRVDVSAVTSRFAALIGQMEASFSHVRALLQHSKLLSDRVLAAIFVALLIFESARYLKSYLTSVEFDNSKTSAGDKKRVTKAPGPTCKLTSSLFIPLLVVTLYFMAITLIVALDYAVYHVVEMILPWLLDFPPTSAGISVDYQLDILVPALCLTPGPCTPKVLAHFHRDYDWAFVPAPALCEVAASAPSPGIAFLLGCLWFLCYFLVFLEVYAARLRRRISASFFREQEERRTAYLAREEHHKSAGHFGPELIMS